MSSESRVKNTRSQILLTIVIVPTLLLAAATAIIGYNIILSSLSKQVEKEMMTTAAMTADTIDAIFPGDYKLVDDGGLRLYKGETDITQDNELVDRPQGITDLEVSLIYKDTRILTTIRDKYDSRIVGTGLADQVNQKLGTSEEGILYQKTMINKSSYFTYYYPLYNSDGSFAGALEICYPHDRVSILAWRPIMIITGMILAVMILLVHLIYVNSSGTDKALKKLLKFTEDAEAGHDGAELDQEILAREDELGIIAQSVVKMHRSLRDMMDKDALTKLYNRRSANRMLDLVRSHYESDGIPYSIAIGDIDFFKKFNDTYGHDAGDAVLITVASILQKNMMPIGFASRWGGEEFLLVFDRMELQAAVKKLNEIADEIRKQELDYDGNTIKITMSFGIASRPELDQDDLIKIADEKLYEAKENGRNRIVADITEEAQ